MRNAAVPLGALLASLVLAGCGGSQVGVPGTSRPDPAGVSPQVVQHGVKPLNFEEFPIPSGGAAEISTGFVNAGLVSHFWLTGDNKILRVSLTGAFDQFAIPTINSQPEGITTGPDGNIWFTETGADKIGRMTTTGAVTEFTIPSTDVQPFQIVTGPDGNLWFTEARGAKVASITPTGTITEYPVPNNPTTVRGIAAGPDGNLWFTQFNSHSYIGRITPQGQVNEFLIATAFADPDSIVAGSDGNLWFTEEANKIGRISTAGSITEFPVALSQGFISNIAAGFHRLFFSVANSNTIGRMETDGTYGLITLPANVRPGAIATGTDGNVWFIDYNQNAVAVHIRLVLTVTPSSLTFTSTGQSQTLTVSETKYNETWTAASTNPAVASVVPGGASNTFSVTSKGAGSCTITVSDDRGNTFPVPTTVQ